MKKDKRVNKSKKKFKTLKSNKAYKWKVRACNKKGCSKWSKTKNLRTNPTKLTSLAVSDVRTRTMTVSWDNVARSKLLERYYLKLLDSEGNEVRTKEYTSTLEEAQTEKDIQMLTPGEEYTLKARAVYSHDKKIRGVYQTETINMDASTYDSSAIEHIDVHTHAVIREEDANVADLITALDAWNVSKMIIVPFPCATSQRTNSASHGDDLAEYFADYTDRMLFMYGGFKLNPILHGLGGEATFDTIDDIYPSGYTGEGDTDAAIAEMQGMAADSETWKQTFKSRARDAAESGNYVGFGEFGPLHYSLHSGHPYVTYPVNHSLLKWLSDLAEENNMVLDIHVESEDEKMDQFEELLEYNENTKIIWDHVGWQNVEQDDLVSLLAQMMADHPNLYMSMKIRDDKSEVATENSPIDSDGNLETDWYEFFVNYGDRIMLGSDNKYWQDDGKDEDYYFKKGTETIQELLDQLPEATATQIYYQTATDLFGI